ncbi:MAG TPA: VWA domain-containing protein [Thermoanaerobaculia bacterium]|nr:VWA domain-containing protein [Thermoanaerobaculia bacterium]
MELRIDPRSGCRSAPAAALLAIGLLGVPLAGQQQSPAEDVPDIFGEVIDVRVVNIEVVVTDRSGVRVRGLKPEDFELIVDGREVPIQYFTEVHGGEATVETGHAALPGLEPGRPVGTNYLLYVDDNHTRKVERDLIIRGLIDQLPHLGEHDRMAVVVQSGPRLEMLSSWSRSARELADALRQLLDGRIYGGSMRSSLYTARSAALRGGRTGPADVEREGPGELRDEDDLPFLGFQSALGEQQLRVDLELAVTGVVSTLRGFAMPPGRKVMLLVAGDWPLGSFRSDGFSLASVTDLDIMQVMVETANLLGYTLYPVGVGMPDNLWRNSNLKRIALRTGGRPLHDHGAVLADAVEDTRTYYWLGFTPDFAGDDSRHDIRVRLRVPGLSARSRQGYVDLSRSAELSMSAQSALLFGHETPGAPLLIDLGAATRWGLRKMDVPIVVYVPLDELTFVEQGGEEIGRIEIRFAVVDTTGSQAHIPIVPVTLRGAREEGDYYRFETSLHMRRRPHELLVSVHDPLGGRTLNGRAEFSFRSTRTSRQR